MTPLLERVLRFSDKAIILDYNTPSSGNQPLSNAAPSTQATCLAQNSRTKAIFKHAPLHIITPHLHTTTSPPSPPLPHFLINPPTPKPKLSIRILSPLASANNSRASCTPSHQRGPTFVPRNFSTVPNYSPTQSPHTSLSSPITSQQSTFIRTHIPLQSMAFSNT